MEGQSVIKSSGFTTTSNGCLPNKKGHTTRNELNLQASFASIDQTIINTVLEFGAMLPSIANDLFSRYPLYRQI